MLKSLHIRNVVLIDQLTLEFAAGLSALTGETGAGKSILLDSLGLALGARAEAGLVRRGTDQASVTATFDLAEQSAIKTMLADQGLSTTDDELIVRRVVGADGRSKAFINDEPVSIGLLKILGEALVDIHGQFETYGLLNPQTHRQVLDQYAGTTAQLAAVSGAYDVWQDRVKTLAAAKLAAQQAAANEAWLRVVVDELENLDPQPGEETELLSLRQKLQHREAILAALTGAADALEGEAGAEAAIGTAWKSLQRAGDKIGDDIKPILETLDQAASTIQDATRQITTLLNGFDSSEHNLETLEDRLYELRGQARKHQCQVDDLPQKRDELAHQLKLIDHQDHVLTDLEQQVKTASAAYETAARKLHEMRLKAAQKLDKQVNKELAPLKLEKATFATALDELPPSQWNSQGLDDIRFQVSTNANTSPGPLNKIASGGEMARFMLALKVVLAEAAPAGGVYVFDEIDTGIGGATASAVGERLARLAEHHQVLVVTHSPQVAARAHHHWMVSKANANTNVLPLRAKDRQEEIARMLAGATITEEARAAAGKLLEASAA